MFRSSEYDMDVNKFIRELNEKKFTTTEETALAAVKIIKKFIGETRWQSASELKILLKSESNRLSELVSSQTVVKNIWKRILKIVRDESTALEQSSHTDSLQENLFNQTRTLTNISDIELKPIMFEAIAEINDEIKDSMSKIAEQSLEHIHTNEIVLTIGKSQTVEAFLKNAARKRKFHVIVAENEPYLTGHELAANLSKVGLDVTVITDSAIFPIMSRVNKIIIGTNTIFANGGLKAQIGAHALALAAHHHHIPLIVCASLFKLSTEYYCNSNNLPDILPPDDVLAIDFQPNVNVLNPSFDYVPPELITLFIFNTASYPPSYVYRLLREMYSMEDESTSDE